MKLLMKKLKAFQVPENLRKIVIEKISNVPRTIRKDAVVLVKFEIDQVVLYDQTLELLKARYGRDNVLETGSKSEMFVIPLSPDGLKLSAKDYFSRDELQRLQRDFLVRVLKLNKPDNSSTDWHMIAMIQGAFIAKMGLNEAIQRDYRNFCFDAQEQYFAKKSGDASWLEL